MTSNKIRFRAFVLIAAALAMGGCNVFKRGARPKTPVVGERIAILANEGDVVVDRSDRGAADVASGRGRQHRMGADRRQCRPSRAAMSRSASALAGLFAVQAGSGNTVDRAASRRRRSSPTGASIRWTRSARCARSTPPPARAIWESQTPERTRQRTFALRRRHRLRQRPHLRHQRPRLRRPRSTSRPAASCGRSRPGGPLRGAPTVADGDALCDEPGQPDLFAQAQPTARPTGPQAAALEIAGVFGTGLAGGRRRARSSPASRRASSTPIATKTAARCGRTRLQRTSIRTSVSSLNDIDASPVIDGGQVFAIGQGGRMVALELTTGQRQWEINVAGISTPWLAGEWLFVVTDDAKLMCVNRAQRQGALDQPAARIPAVRRRSAARSTISGPILAGGRLIVVGIQWRDRQRRSGDRLVPEPDAGQGAGSARRRSSPIRRSTSTTTTAMLHAYR